MNIQHTQTRGGEFFIEEDNKKVANLEYTRSGDNIIVITHTMVAGKLEGKGIGKSLVEEAVKFARENNLKIRPLCPFAAAVMRKTEVYGDVLV